jgi:hypothetical protein
MLKRTLTLTAFALSFTTVGCGDKPGSDATDSSTPVSVDADDDGFTADEDCDDSDAAINPDADEICDGVDNNCDEVVDTDAVDAGTWYADTDADGFGDAASGTVSCEMPSTMTADNTDCDDGNADINSDADEVCDGVDNNCDTVVDTDAVDQGTWYADTDGDGYGDMNDAGTLACEMPANTSADNTDCDDTSAVLNPSDTDTDGVSSCDGDCDDTDSTLNTLDSDADGMSSCDGDCDDTEAAYTDVCPQPSCADILAADSTSVDGLYLIDYGSGPMDLYCDMTGGGVTIENFGLGPYTDTFTGWEWIDHAEFTGFAVSDAMAHFYTANGGLENLDPGFNSDNCCIVSADIKSNTPYYAFEGGVYMYPANADGTQNCSRTYKDAVMQLWLQDTETTWSSLTQAQVQDVGTSSKCQISANPGIFIQRW